MTTQTDRLLARNIIVDTYPLVATNGRYIRMATRVRFPDGYICTFADRLPKGEARRQAIALRTREGYTETPRVGR